MSALRSATTAPAPRSSRSRRWVPAPLPRPRRPTTAARVQAVKDPAGTISRTFYTADQVTKTVVDCTNSGTTVPTSGWETCTGAGTQDGTYNLTTISTYDGAGNRTGETAPNGRLTTSTYDDAGRVTSQIVNVVASPTLQYRLNEVDGNVLAVAAGARCLCVDRVGFSPASLVLVFHHAALPPQETTPLPTVATCS